MFSHPEERDEFPWFSHRYCPDKPSSRSMCPNRLLVRVLSCIVPFPHYAPRGCPPLIRLSDQFSFADTRSHSPTTVAHGSITHTRTIIAPIPSIVKPAMHRHVRVAIFVSQLANCGRFNKGLFLLLLTYSNDAFNLPCVFTAATRSRQHASVVCHTVFPFPPNTARYPLYCMSTADQPNRRV